MDRLCFTRGIKNSRQLQAVLPELFPSPEPREGFAQSVPSSVLSRLDRLLSDPRSALPPFLAPYRQRLRLASASGAPVGPLFTGTLVFAAVEFNTSSGSLSVGTTDLRTVIQFVRQASGPISRYAGQYGPNAVSVSLQPISFAASVPNEKYNDATLQGWVNDFVARNGLPAHDCVVVLNPPGVENVDAPASTGILGYHGLANTPYLFVNVLGAGLSVSDVTDEFALALSHEIAEMVVDPRADGSNPEVCDPCGPNCQPALRDYFDLSGTYLRTTAAFPPPFSYGFYINAIVQPGAATACPAPVGSCAYPPP